ncbi:MAG: hypothetical protein HQL26_10400 [Candidatus Omnitrophica bacterium]|nr:hypothetical protein [Candidatus Omnitrophota bacterium]
MKKNNRAQMTLEFIFCMIVVFLIIYSLTKVMAWSGKGFVGIFQAHHDDLKGGKYIDKLDSEFGQDAQMAKDMNSVYTGKNPGQKE